MGSIGAVSSPSGFKEGDTPRVLVDTENYSLVKMNNKGTLDAGTLSGKDIKSMLQGYKFNGLFWDKPNSRTIYEVAKVRR